ncbi:MAG: NAD(P)-dependent oxidoreductase [Pyrinomonadaceae bacterium]|nr:NAD(P)-dependent oxidoreductase [Pyrinomonadaceae bacterium]
MKRVLLTGATGFIGRHCLPSLSASGYEVHAVSSKSQQKTSDVSWHQADLLDLSQVSGLLNSVRPTHLLHLAWDVTSGKYWKSSENFRWVQAGVHLSQEFASCGGQRIVTAGTCAEYDWTYGYCSERLTPILPTTVYGACKHALQVMTDAFAEQSGMSAAWGRIFFLYGPHERPERVVSSVIRSLMRGEPARCSHGNQIRDFLYVQDVADAFVALLSSDVSGPINFASGSPIAVKEIIQNIAEKLGRPELVQFGALPSAPNDPYVLIADARRLREEVGWRSQYDLDQGLELTIKWWSHQLD